jgi:hypothetical protein
MKYYKIFTREISVKISISIEHGKDEWRGIIRRSYPGYNHSAG